MVMQSAWRVLAVVLVCLLGSVCLAQRGAHDPNTLPIAASTNLLPHFEQANGRKVLYVDGLPFTVLAVEIPWWDILPRAPETHTAYDHLYPAARKMGLNALKVPIKWSVVEPEKGVYDFAYVDHAKAMAEQHGLKLVLNWFGHYASNDGTIYGNLAGQLYAPRYVVEDERTYPRAVDADGVAHHNAVSYEYQPVIEREIAAFRAFMEHLKKVDAQSRTVVMVQVENEIAVFGWDRQNRKLWRDHSPAAERIFVEKGFTDDLKYSAWRLSTHWIGPLSDAGAAVYPLPFFHNYVGGKVADWMVGGAPGEDVATALENCSHIAFIGLNLYVSPDASADELRQALARYRVGRNLPAITETNSGPDPVAPRLAYLAVGEFGAPIFAPWALNVSYPAAYAPYVLADGTLANGAFALREAYTSLRLALAAIAYFGATDHVKVFLSPLPGQKFTQTTKMEGFTMTVSGAKDGQVMIVHPSPNELLIVGYRCEVTVNSPAFRWPALKSVSVGRGHWVGMRWVKEGEPLYGFDQSKSSLSVDLDHAQAVRIRW